MWLGCGGALVLAANLVAWANIERERRSGTGVGHRDGAVDFCGCSSCGGWELSQRVSG